MVLALECDNAVARIQGLVLSSSQGSSITSYKHQVGYGLSNFSSSMADAHNSVFSGESHRGQNDGLVESVP